MVSFNCLYYKSVISKHTNCVSLLYTFKVPMAIHPTAQNQVFKLTSCSHMYMLLKLAIAICTLNFNVNMCISDITISSLCIVSTYNDVPLQPELKFSTTVTGWCMTSPLIFFNSLLKPFLSGNPTQWKYIPFQLCAAVHNVVTYNISIQGYAWRGRSTGFQRDTELVCMTNPLIFFNSLLKSFLSEGIFHFNCVQLYIMWWHNIRVIPCQINQEFRVTWLTSQILTKLGVLVVPMGLTTHANF